MEKTTAASTTASIGIRRKRRMSTPVTTTERSWLLVSPTLFPRPCYYYYYSSLNQVTTSMLQLMMGILLCLLFILPLMNICTVVHVGGEPVPMPKSKATSVTQATSVIGVTGVTGGGGSSIFNSRIITVSPGEVIHLPCTLDRSGDATVQWMKNGQPILLDSSASERRHWNVSSEGQAYLTIARVTKEDEGSWECLELEYSGRVKQRAHILDLIVADGPEAPYLELNGKRLTLKSTVSVHEKQVITLRCSVTASPAVTFMDWFIGDQNLTHFSQLFMEYNEAQDKYTSTSVLTLNVTKELNGKTVACYPEHAAWKRPTEATAVFDVNYEPTFAISREPGFGFPVVQGMTISLKCEIDANPWSPAGWVLDTSAGNVTLATDTEGTFRITFAKESDSGWYRCVTYNQEKLFSSYAYYLHVRDKMPQGLPASFRPCTKGSAANSQAQPHEVSSGSGSTRVTSAKIWNASSASEVTSFTSVNNVILYTCLLYFTLAIIKTSFQLP